MIPAQTQRRWFADCVRVCDDCKRACNDAARTCIDSPEVKCLLRCISLNRDCRLLCNTVLLLLLQDASEFLRQAIKLCVDACATCASENERSAPPPCRRAAAACRSFAQVCHRINLG